MKLLVLLGAVLALALAGCGGTELDVAKTEESMKVELERSTGIEATSMDCPSGVGVEAGTQFECTLTEKGGKEIPVRLEILDEDANLKLLNTSSFE